MPADVSYATFFDEEVRLQIGGVTSSDFTANIQSLNQNLTAIMQRSIYSTRRLVMKTSCFFIDGISNARSHKRLLKGNLLPAVLPVCLALASHSALAQDGKDYPGGLCKPLNNNTNYDISSTEGHLINPNSFAIQVHCPGIHDEDSSVNGQVNYIDNNVNQNIVCTLRTRSRTGASVGAQTLSSSGVNSNIQTLSFGTVRSEGNAIHFFDCTIPGTQDGIASRITSFELEDNP